MNTIDAPMKLERQKFIRQTVEENNRVTVPELSERFGVSEATIRRDLEELSSQGLIRRTHGGAVRVEPAAEESPMLQRISEQHAEKQRIGRYAASLIQEGETIFLGSGTTVLEIANHIPVDKRLTVITNSLPVVNQLARHPKVELIVIGGMLRQSELSMVGHVAEEAIKEFRADKVFMGMHAIDAHHGFTNDYLPEVRTDRAILEISSNVIVVADHSKFGLLSSNLVAPVTAAMTIITDDGVHPGSNQALEELGLQVIQV
jgi:DeoR/GlpR family transcriptional regulator of sugar metabolism